VNILESIKIGLLNLKVNPLRSWLTMLGVIIGVAAVIAVVAFGEGNRKKIEAEIAKMGSDVFWVMPKRENIDITDYQQMMKSRQTRSLTANDIQSLREYGTKIKALAPVVRSTSTAFFKERTNLFELIATEPDYQKIRGLTLARGRFLIESDLVQRRSVCVVELSESAIKLFGGIDPLGQRLSIEGRKFEVVGVALEKDDSFMKSPHGLLYVPLTTTGYLSGNREIDILYCQSNGSEVVSGAMIEAETILKSRYHGKDFFDARNMTEWMRSAQKLSRTAALVTAGIAAISLLVGGIGIMNIMLVSVSERTGEIGLRKAIGARRKDIRRQFLLEAATLSSIGGMIGIGLGVLLAQLISPTLKIPVFVSPISITVGFFFSSGVGMLSGFYPAFRASRLNPIEALRYE
jgi:putative ABC transport system permease protein